MSKPQIQYSPLAGPPVWTAVVPPTVAQLGWRPSYPDSAQPFSDRREYRTRGGGSRGIYDTQSHAVFVPEKWAIPLGAGAEFPDRPHLTINRRDLRLRGGGYAALYDTQSHTVFAVEQWTTPKGALFEGPDNPQQFLNRRDYRLKGGGYRAALDPSSMPMDFTQPVASTPFVLTELPDDPRLGRNRSIRWPVYPQTEFGVEVDVPVESWEACFPDLPPFARPVRSLLVPSTVSPFTQTAATLTFAQVELPDDGRPGRRLQLTTAAMLAAVSDGWSGLEQRAPTLLWSVAYPDGTRRATLAPANVPSVFRTEAFEQWARLASTTCPDVTRRAALAIADMPTLFKGEAIEQFAPTLLWTASTVDRAVRALRLAEYPAVFLTPQQIAALAVTTGWTPMLVDAARRASRLPEYPALTLSLALEQLAIPTVSWLPRLVERAVRAKVLPEYPALTIPIGLEQWTVPALSWQPRLVERAVRVKAVIEYPAFSLNPGLISSAAPTLSWAPCESERPVRATRLPDYPAFAFGLGIERWAVPGVFWRPAGAERPVRAKRLPVYPALAFTSTEDGAPLVLDVHGWRGSAPDRVWIPRLPVATYPGLFGRGQNRTPLEIIRATLPISQGTARWDVLSNLPTTVAKHTILDFNDSLWIFAGRKVFKSDDDGETWAEVGIDALPDDYTAHMACAFGGKMWLLGGLASGVATDLIYTSTDGLTWVQPTVATPHGSLVARLPFAAVSYGAGCIADDDYIYLVGGRAADGTTTRKVYRSLFVGSNTGPNWVEMGVDALPLDVGEPGVVRHGGTVFALGGFSTSLAGYSQKVFAASADLSVWTEVGSNVLPYPLAPGNNVVSQGGYLWLPGGADAGATFRRVFRSLAGATWLETASLPTTVGYGAAIVANGAVILTGGDTRVTFDPTDTVYRFAFVAGMRATLTIPKRLTSREEL